MPAEQRLRRYRERPPALPRQQPARGSQQQPLASPKRRPLHRPPQHGQLVTEHSVLHFERGNRRTRRRREAAPASPSARGRRTPADRTDRSEPVRIRVSAPYRLQPTAWTRGCPTRSRASRRPPQRGKRRPPLVGRKSSPRGRSSSTAQSATAASVVARFTRYGICEPGIPRDCQSRHSHQDGRNPVLPVPVDADEGLRRGSVPTAKSGLIARPTNPDRVVIRPSQMAKCCASAQRRGAALDGTAPRLVALAPVLSDHSASRTPAPGPRSRRGRSRR